MQFCLGPGLTLTYFYCLRSRTCTENGDEACYCCTEDYCNTEGFYNKKFGITNAPIDPSSTKSTSTSERPSESASLLCLCSCMCACCLLDLEYMTCASPERIWAVTKILADTCRGALYKIKRHVNASDHPSAGWFGLGTLQKSGCFTMVYHGAIS